jgi:hypothetical protein
MAKPFKIDPKDPRVDQLILFLKDKGHVTRREIGNKLGWQDRTIRAIVEASQGEILATQRGYIITIQASQEEAEKSDQALLSQAKTNMARRAQQIRVRHHGTRRPHLFKVNRSEPPIEEFDLFSETSTGGYGSGL